MPPRSNDSTTTAKAREESVRGREKAAKITLSDEVCRKEGFHALDLSDGQVFVRVILRSDGDRKVQILHSNYKGDFPERHGDVDLTWINSSELFPMIISHVHAALRSNKRYRVIKTTVYKSHD